MNFLQDIILKFLNIFAAKDDKFFLKYPSINTIIKLHKITTTIVLLYKQLVKQKRERK